MVDKTPILDIKPYLPPYDVIPNVICADWVINAPVKVNSSRTNTSHIILIQKVNVVWNEIAIQQLTEFVENKKLIFYQDLSELKSVIEEILCQDPRSVVWRKIKEEKYGFRIDILNIFCNFEISNEPNENGEELNLQNVNIMEIQDWSEKYNWN